MLLIACANIASLLLARGASRTREMAVRLAIGSSRWRIVRQLMIENLVLAALAIPVSLGLTWWMIQLIRVNMPARIAVLVPGWNQMDLDGGVILVTAAGAIVATLFFGLLPALQSSSMSSSTRSKRADADRQPDVCACAGCSSPPRSPSRCRCSSRPA